MKMDINQLLDLTHQLLQKDTLGLLLSISAVIISIIALYYHYHKSRNLTFDILMTQLEIKSKKARRKAQFLSGDEKADLLIKLDGIDKIIQDYHEGKLDEEISKMKQKEAGFASVDFLLYVVPAIIALTFTFTLVYLLIVNQANPQYQSPDVLKSGLSTIIGYYFGVTVKDKSNPQVPSLETISLDEIKKLIADNAE